MVEKCRGGERIELAYRQKTTPHFVSRNLKIPQHTPSLRGYSSGESGARPRSSRPCVFFRAMGRFVDFSSRFTKYYVVSYLEQPPTGERS